MNHAKKYIVKVFDKTNQLIVQVSDPHTWGECELVYLAYMEDYADCEIIIRMLSTREMMDKVYDALHVEK